MTISSSSVKKIFDEEAAKVAKIPGISSAQVNIAKEYMLNQMDQEWPSDFLTTDLMGHLDGGGALKGKL